MVVVVASAGAEVEHGALAKRTPTVDSGSERRRTTDWRSVTCSIRPTRPPEVITGMPTVIALAAALVDRDRLVEVRRRPGDDLGLAPGRSPDRVGRPNVGLELLVLVHDGLGRDGGAVLGLDPVAQLVVLAA